MMRRLRDFWIIFTFLFVPDLFYSNLWNIKRRKLILGDFFHYLKKLTSFDLTRIFFIVWRNWLSFLTSFDSTRISFTVWRKETDTRTYSNFTRKSRKSQKILLLYALGAISPENPQKFLLQYIYPELIFSNHWTRYSGNPNYNCKFYLPIWEY